MDQRIIDLKSTTFSGRRLNRQQIADVQETVELLPDDSRNELAKTICEHLGWKTAKGACKVGACLGMLETLESHGILKLPPKREDSVRDMKAVDTPAWTSASDPQPEIAAPLSDLGPLRVEPVTDAEGRQLWNALVDRHHCLGCRRPFGAHIRHFVTDRDGRRLGCLLFEAVTKTLPCRDRWIGWTGRRRDRSRHLMVVNSRYLLFPWVRSKNLASSALAMATRRLADDRERIHGYRPVLCETFVDETREKLDEAAFKRLHREILAGRAAGSWPSAGRRSPCRESSRCTASAWPTAPATPRAWPASSAGCATASRSTTRTSGRPLSRTWTMPPKATSSCTTGDASRSRWRRPAGSAGRTSSSASGGTRTPCSTASSPRARATGP